MVRNKKIKYAAFIAAILLMILPVTAASGIYAYLTDTAPVLKNNFTIALDPVTTIVEKFPTKEPEAAGNNAIRFLKAVQIANKGFIDCYVRVRLQFSDTDIRDKSFMSWDGTNYYSYADYKNHLPAGWTYDSSEDCFYYTPILYAGDWTNFSKDFTYDKTSGEYFYKDGDNNIRQNNIITTPLIKYVKIQFSSPNDMRTFQLNAIEESVPFYLGSDYRSAWTNYEND